MTLFSLALPVSFALQATPQSPVVQNPPPVYRTNVRDVVVDVVVTQKNGEPVPGIPAKDFIVLEDGKPQTIDYFEEHPSEHNPQRGLKPFPNTPSGVYSNAQPAPESDAVNVLLLDSLNTETKDQAYVRLQLLHFLHTMQPGTRAAIFALGSRLRYIQGFTSDTSQLIAALEDKKKGGFPQRDGAFRSRSDIDDEKDEVHLMILGLNGHRNAGVDALESAQAQTAASQYRNRMEITLQALQALARYLAAVPGRKNLLWFAGSYPITIFPSGQEPQSLSAERPSLRKVKNTADLITSSDIAIYPINAQGLMHSHVMESDEWKAPSRNGSDNFEETSEMAATIQGMERLASDTGGKAFFNTDDLASAMRTAIADGSRYYTLTYSPENKKMDGAFRRIEVKLPGTNYKLSYRRGYNASDSGATDTNADSTPLRELMAPGMPDSTQIFFSIRALPTSTQPPPKAPRAGKNDKLSGPVKRYDIDFAIRADELKLDETPEGRRTGRIEIDLVAYDRDEHPLNWDGAIQVMNITPSTFDDIRASGVPAHFQIDLPANGQVKLVAGVYDFATGKVGTVHTRLTP